MIIFKSIPFGLCHDFVACCSAHTDLVTVELRCEAIAILVSHFVLLCLDHALSARFNTLDEGLRVGRITDALEELDTLLALKFLQLAVLFDEILLVHRQFDTLELVKDRSLSLTVAFS